MMTSRNRAPLHPMKPNVPRILAAISFIIDQGRQRGQRITQYDIVKALFLADKASLNKFGRPITFDNYVAMKDGPVPSLAYDFLKGDRNQLQHHRVTLPWTSKPPEFGQRARAFEIQAENVCFDALAPSDIEALASALTVVKSLGFSQVRRLTHEDPAYVEAWDAEGVSKSYSMSYSLLFDIPNEEMASELSFLSNHV